jgi:hypothetical protein
MIKNDNDPPVNANSYTPHEYQSHADHAWQELPLKVNHKVQDDIHFSIYCYPVPFSL